MENKSTGAGWLADRTGGGGSACRVQELAARALESERAMRDSDRYSPGCRAAVRCIGGEASCSWYWYTAATNPALRIDTRIIT